MVDNLNLTLIIEGGATAAGLIQYLKGAVPKLPSWAWAIISPALCIAYAIAPQWGRDAAMMLAVSQLGWDILIQPVRKWIESKAQPPAGGAS